MAWEIKKGRRVDDRNSDNDTLCWDCGNTECSWHKSLEPVDGWTIRKGVADDRISVRKCPLFEKVYTCRGKEVNTAIWWHIDQLWLGYKEQLRVVALPQSDYAKLEEYLSSIGITDMTEYYGVPVKKATGLKVADYRRWKKCN